MREKLIQYVNLLFAGTDCEEIRDEILQNTLDRYDDLIAQGKAPEAAYRLAIAGIGDINEILGSEPPSRETVLPQEDESKAKENQLKHAVSIAMYILCPIPLFILSEFGYETMGLCMTLLLVAAATALRLTMKRTPRPREAAVQYSPRQELTKSIDHVIWVIGLLLYFIISFTSGAWMITWIIFPLIGAVQGLVKAIMDLKEAVDHEN
ncbi:MAG: hypothetical protein IJZ39_08155 [Oscillospiraceae bacterium]|nr:hypothetical protein [Oscillospiraceae bacterium]